MGIKNPADLSGAGMKKAVPGGASPEFMILCVFYFFFLLNRYVTTIIRIPITLAVVVPSNVINTLSDSLKFVVSVPDKKQYHEHSKHVYGGK